VHVTDDDLITFMLRGDNGEVLNVLGYMYEDLPMGQLDEVRYALEEWHRAHLWPTCFWRDNEDAGLTFSVGGAVAVDYEHGVTDDQLAQHVYGAIASATENATVISQLYRALLTENIEVELR